MDRAANFPLHYVSCISCGALTQSGLPALHARQQIATQQYRMLHHSNLEEAVLALLLEGAQGGGQTQHYFSKGGTDREINGWSERHGDLPIY